MYVDVAHRAIVEPYYNEDRSGYEAYWRLTCTKNYCAQWVTIPKSSATVPSKKMNQLTSIGMVSWLY